MPGEFFFLTFGGLGISLAGFAGLIFVLDRRKDPDHPIARWRVMHIGSTGLSIAQTGLVVFPAFYLSDSVELTVRITSLIGLLLFSGPKFNLHRRSPAWPNERRRQVNIAIEFATAIGWIISVVIGSVGFLMLLFVVWISGGIGTFMTAITEFRLDRDVVDPPSDPESLAGP
jgi:hypothetical protein